MTPPPIPRRRPASCPYCYHCQAATRRPTPPPAAAPPAPRVDLPVRTLAAVGALLALLGWLR
jgi:hypothetical protein